MIPVFDIKRQNRILKKELDSAISEVIERGIFILGPKVSEFEEKFAKYIGVKYAVGVASGTDALSLSLMAWGVGVGDEVILPANAYPSAFAVTAIGAIPKLVDIDRISYNIDPHKIPQAITSKTKAIIPVHLYGQPAEMQEIMAIGKKYKLPVIEDCAQAHGAEIGIDLTELANFAEVAKTFSAPPKHQKSDGRAQKSSLPANFKFRLKVGSIGQTGCFSFYPTKNLGCFGDGGMVVTNNKEIYDKVKLLRMYGEKRRYESVLLGRNSRLDELQAAILLVKLNYLDKWNERRREIAALYFKEFAERGFAGPVTEKDFAEVGMNFLRTSQRVHLEPARKLSLPAKSSSSLAPPALKSEVKHVYHLYVIRTNKRDQLKAYLEKKGIQTAIHYPMPIHLEKSFQYLGYKEGDFPESKRASREILSLPMFPELKDSEVEKVVKELNKFLINA